MNEITRTALYLIVDTAIVAVVVEAIKKLMGETALTDCGKIRIKTVLSKTAIIIIAVLLSLATVAVTYYGGALYGKKILILLYWLIVFVGQWFIDMALVKKLIEKIIEKILNKM